MEQRKCRTCDALRELDERHFYRDRWAPGGFKTQCVECAIAYNAGRYKPVPWDKPRRNPVKPSIDLGLAVLTAMSREYGHTFTLADIAEVCECQPSTILELERQAKHHVYEILHPDHNEAQVDPRLSSVFPDRRTFRGR